MKTLIILITLIFVSNISIAQSPGNIGTADLTAWYKADVLTLGDVTSWTTSFASGGPLSLTAPGPNYPQATYTPIGNASNYNMTVDFNGNSDASPRVLANSSSLNLLNNQFSTDQGSFFSAYKLPSSTSCAGCHLVNYIEPTSDGIQFRARLGSGLGRLAIGSGNSSFASRDWTQDFTRDLKSYVGTRSSSSSMNAFTKDRVFTGGVSSASTGMNGLYIGARRNGSTGVYHATFDGLVHEIIFYDRDLTLAEVNLVHTYLGVKFGVCLDNTGGGTQGDYTATDNTVVWDADLSPSYHNDVIGLAREDNEALLQKQSHTEDDITRVYLNTLAGNNPANSATAATFGADVSYLMVGHNQGALCSTVASAAEMPGGCGLYSRLEREWKATKTRFSSNCNVDITLDPCANTGSVNVSQLRFLVDDDGDFSNGGTTCYFNGDGTGIVISYANPVVTVSNISSAHIANFSTQYFTIASIQETTPLPIELGWFTADKTDNRTVALNWMTLSEQENDYFILEKSINGKTWEHVMTVDGAGNSNEELYYSEIDFNPFTGASFYRLKQVDFNGHESISSIRVVEFIDVVTDEIKIYPNPSNGLFIVEGVSDLSELRIHDMVGHELNLEGRLTIINKGLSIDMNGLSSGIYLLYSGGQKLKIILE